MVFLVLSGGFRGERPRSAILAVRDEHHCVSYGALARNELGRQEVEEQRYFGGVVWLAVVDGVGDGVRPLAREWLVCHGAPSSDVDAPWDGRPIVLRSRPESAGNEKGRATSRHAAFPGDEGTRTGARDDAGRSHCRCGRWCSRSGSWC